MNTNKKAKRILVYGDSFTFGKIPGGLRYDVETRFTGILQKTLGQNYEIIEEGLRGRTIEGENKFFPYRNGFPQFGPIYGSHVPIDLLVLFLGTNNLNSKSDVPVDKLPRLYEKYLERVEWWSDHLGFRKPKIMIVAPPEINERKLDKTFREIFAKSESKSRKLPKLLEEFAKDSDLLFFDSSKVVKASDVDGVHLTAESNQILGRSLAEKILSVL